MTDKEQLILNNAIKLFSHKGFSQTSMQAIADECDISKGALYAYFKSKNDLLFAALEYYFDSILVRISTIAEPKDPHERLVTQLTYFFENVIEHREFMELPYEQGGYLSESIRQVIRDKYTDVHRFYMQGLEAIYGQPIKPILYDLALMLEGMIRAYIPVIIHANSHYDMESLIRFVLKRVDDIVNGFSTREDLPFLNDIQVKQLLKKAHDQQLSWYDAIELRLSKLEEVVQNLPQASDYQVSIDVIRDELNRKQVRKPVITGMLSNLNDVPHAHRYVHEIEMVLYHDMTI
ncbi:TetR/AcrR family transcriptional regulator [Alkalibacillus salilacus]|uniref:AcrR family transcriptional regulator n=1 Tax=Alkalibacillus salilacus TaxID=284582 RepID=A0ABT9VEI8_9BACI|nr:TetR/AcrR family transcriptional regulator [Alkalibacillus salilacus]MDQ0159386.1 AcrR family transcriptional regulator [Alkalibacillus salilacus]